MPAWATQSVPSVVSSIDLYMKFDQLDWLDHHWSTQRNPAPTGRCIYILFVCIYIYTYTYLCQQCISNQILQFNCYCIYIYDILYHNISLYGTKHLNIGDQLPASILDRSSNSVSQVATGSYCVPEMRILLQALHDISWISHVTIGNANNVNISHVYIYVHIYTDCIYEYV